MQSSNSYPRDGVRVNSGGVYKGVESQLAPAKYEYVERRNHSGAALAIGLLLVGVIIFAIMHADAIKAALQL